MAEAFELPTEKSTKCDALWDFIILCYGGKKIGKTSMFSHAEDALFCMFEPGSKSQELYEVACKNWSTFRKVVRELSKDDERFNPIILDTADLAYDMANLYACRQEGISHPSDAEYGKGWAAVKNEFIRQLNTVGMSGRGLVFISHAVEKKIERRSGASFDKVVPSMSGQAFGVVEALADIIIHYDYEGDERMMTIKGNDLICAGHRLDEHFRYPDGSPITKIPGGRDSLEAWVNFNKAFNNELEKPTTKKAKKKRPSK